MYTEFTIQDYCQFQDFKIENLARFNLIGGENGVGKTILLQAIARNIVTPDNDTPRRFHEYGYPLHYVEHGRLPAIDPSGILLIDGGFESGIHYSNYERVIRFYFEAAQQYDAQIFATTYSQDFVQEALDFLGEDLRYHRLDRVGDTVKAATYEPDVLAAVFECNMCIF